MNKYIVVGTLYEHVATLHCLAMDRNSAVVEWVQFFGERVHKGWRVEVFSEKDTAFNLRAAFEEGASFIG